MEAGLAFEPWAKPGDRLIVADKLADDVFARPPRSPAWRRVEAVDPSGADLRAPAGRARRRLRLRRAAAGRRPRHRRRRHRLRPHRARPRRGRLPGLAERATAIATIPDMVDPDGAYYPHVPLFGGLKVLETEGKKAGKFGPANPAVIEQADRGRQPAGARAAGAQLSALLALQGAGDLPQHAAVVHPHGRAADDRRRPCARRALEAIDATAFYPRGRARTASARMVESRPDWLISRQRAWGTPLAMFVDKETGQPLHDAEVNARIVDADRAPRAPTPGSPAPARDFLGNHDPDALREDRRHPRRLVRLRLDPRLHAGEPRRQPLAGRPLPGGLRPAPRLVPVLAAGGLRHARPRALRGRAHPRLHPRRAGREDVEVARQHHRARRR